jgi:hypothetical protein
MVRLSALVLMVSISKRRGQKCFQELLINLLRHIFADGLVGPSKCVLAVEVNPPMPVLSSPVSD